MLVLAAFLFDGHFLLLHKQLTLSELQVLRDKKS